MKVLDYDFSKREVGFVIVIVALVLASGAYAWSISNRDHALASIDSFQACVDAGNPVMESYPEQCAANGQTFTNPAQQVPPASVPNQTNDAFKIPELGVQFTLNPELTSLYYYIATDKPNIAYFSLEQFRGTDCAADEVSIGALSKLTEAEVEADEVLSENPDSLQEINDYYYQTASPQASCSEDDSVQAKASVAGASLLQTIKDTLQAIE